MLDILLKNIKKKASLELIEQKSTSFGELVQFNQLLIVHFIFISKISKDNYFNSLLKFNAPYKNNSIRFLCLYEDELLHNFDIVESRILSILGVTHRIYARKTELVKITKPELLEFLNNHHGNETFNSKYKYGLSYQNELVAVATFGQLMHKKYEAQGKWSGELIRFCNKKHTTVVGGLSKLLNHFIKLHKVDDVMTYADKDWSDGKSYLGLGFEKVGETKPHEYFIDTKTLKRHNKFTKQESTNPLISVFTPGSIKLILNISHGK